MNGICLILLNRKRDMTRKSRDHDPLAEINRKLASSSSSRPRPSTYPSSRKPPAVNSGEQSATSERISRESSERQRALLLRQKRQQELNQLTPSTNRDDDFAADMYNRRDVVDARRRREGRRY